MTKIYCPVKKKHYDPIGTVINKCPGCGKAIHREVPK
jgi:hypothetical protein